MFDDLQKQQNNQQQENKSDNPAQDVPQQPVAPKEDVSQRIEKLKEKGIKQGSRKKLYSIIGIAVILFFVGGVVAGSYFYRDDIINFLSSKDEDGVACPADAKICPDGSSVGRVPPDCEFAECPSEKELSNEKSLIIPSEWMTCKKNSDCAEIHPDCCSCNGGGRQIAINKKYISQWEEKIRNVCMDIGCPAVVTCKPGYPLCVNKLCKYIEVSAEDCVKEGESYPVEEQLYACCMGSRPISCNIPDEQKECEEDCVEIMYCTACGNGECKEPENICNCPQDCLSQIPECRVLQGEARKECECVALGGWWNSDRCYPLTSDVGEFCTDSSECEGECIGANWEATSGECGEWTVEKDCHYVLLNGKVNFEIGCEKIEENNQDSDDDGLFDDEELQYGTDINNPDSDGDGFLDGDEVENGYNPMGEGVLK